MRDEDDFLRVKGITMDNKEEIFGTVDPVTEEKGDMIDFGLVEDEKAAEHIDHEIETIVEATVALEAYQKILECNSLDGISKQSAQAMRIGVARIDRLLNQRSTLVAALEDEDYSAPRIGQEKSGVNKEGISGRIKELWKKFVELFKKGIAKMRSGLQKVNAKIKQGTQRIEKLREDFKNWSPNGPKGGKKITVPARVASLSYPGGAHVDMTQVIGIATWCHTQLTPAILKGYAALRALKGTESAEQVTAAVNIQVPALPTFPPSGKGEIVDGLIDFEIISGEAVTIPVRSKQEINKAFDYAGKLNDVSDANQKAADDLFVASLELIDMDWDVRFKGSSDVISTLQDSIRHLSALVSQHREIMLYALSTNIAVLDHASIERGYKTTEEVEENSIV